MITFDYLEHCILFSKFNPTNIKSVYDGTIFFRIGEFLWAAELDTLSSSIDISVEITEEHLQLRGLHIDEDELIYLCNEINDHFRGIKTYYVTGTGGFCVNIRKSISYSSQKDIKLQLSDCIAKVTVLCDAFFNIMQCYLIDHVLPVYEIIESNYNTSLCEHIKRFSPKLNVLVIGNINSNSAPNLSLKENIENLIPQWDVTILPPMISPNEIYNLALNMIHANPNSIVIGVESGCIIANKVKGIPKLFLNPCFHNSEYMRKLEKDEALERYNEDVINEFNEFENGQFKKITFNETQRTYAIVWSQHNYEKSVNDYQRYFGPFQDIPSDNFITSDKVILNVIIPTISQLVNCTNRIY